MIGRLRVPPFTLVVIALGVAGCGGGSASTAPSPTSAAPTATATSTATTASTATTSAAADLVPAAHGPTGGSGEPVHGVRCESREFAVTHTHTSLAILLAGQRVTVPAFVGIVDDTCLYWLHTHGDRGVLHVESPSADRHFTLGDFFAVWGWPLGRDRVLGTTGKVYAWLQGKPWTGDPALIPLNDMQSIVLSDQPNAPQPKPDFSELQ